MKLDSAQILWDMLLAMIQLLWSVWPLTLVVALVFLIQVGSSLYRRYRLSKSGIADLDRLNGKEFERYLGIFFKKLGYQVRRTPYQGDYGADLIVRRGDEEIAVQAKRYNRRVGVKAIQEAVTAKEYYGCNQAMVVTNSQFSRQAKTLARANRVELWDRNELVKRLIALKEGNPKSSASALVASTESQETQTPSGAVPLACAKCGKTVSIKVRDYCMDNQAAFGGRIYCYDHQKEIRKAQRPL